MPATKLTPTTLLRSTRKAVAALGFTALVASVGCADLGAGSDDQTVAVAAQTALPPATKVVFTGHGWGHGHGMSQFGAQGAALRGKSWQQIVGFYYPKTHGGGTSGQIRVRLTEDTTREVTVVARQGLRAHKVGSKTTWNLTKRHPNAGRWRIAPVDGNRDRLQFRRGGKWHTDLTVSARLEFNAGGGPIRLVLPDGSTDAYRGTLRAAKPGKGADRDTVNILWLDAYLRGVVPSEVYTSWKPAALQAQAVAARSYAAFQRRYQKNGYYDVVDTTADQAYGGADAEVASTDAAIKRTVGKIRKYAGAPAFTQFSSSMGGFTLKGSKPYLVSQADPYEKYSSNPYATWKHTLTVRQLNRRWPGAGGIAGVRLTKVPGTDGRYVQTVIIDGVKNDYRMSGWDFRNWSGMRSPWFSRTIQKP